MQNASYLKPFTSYTLVKFTGVNSEVCKCSYFLYVKIEGDLQKNIKIMFYKAMILRSVVKNVPITLAVKKCKQITMLSWLQGRVSNLAAGKTSWRNSLTGIESTSAWCMRNSHNSTKLAVHQRLKIVRSRETEETSCVGYLIIRNA